MIIQMARILFLVLLSVLAKPASAFEQTFESCALTAWETFHVARFYQDDVPLDKALAISANKPNVEVIYRIASKAGVASARMAALGNFTSCAKHVKSRSGIANLAKREQSAYTCSYRAATNHQILAGIENNVGLGKLKQELPKSLHSVILLLDEKVKNRSFASAVSDVSRATQVCIERILF